MKVPLRLVLDACMRSRLLAEDEAARGLQWAGQEQDAYRIASLVGRVPRRHVLHAVAQYSQLSLYPAEVLRPDVQAIERLPSSLQRDQRILPLIAEPGAEQSLLITGPQDASLIDIAGRSLGRRCRGFLADPVEIRAAWERLSAGGDSTRDQGPDMGAVHLLDDVLIEAWCHRATDIHIEPQAEGYRIRLRIDGRLEPLRLGLPVAQATALISRLKVLSELDIAETRAPQDGGCRHRIRVDRLRVLEMRLATIPTRQGERMTIRLLGVGLEGASIDDLDISPPGKALLLQALSQPHGLIVITGATGSGKSTTLYACLRHLAEDFRNLLTVEDPVESRIPGISQVQVDSVGKVSFAAALRSMLRHDPDVIMVGEIRDAETATLALQAACTGHLVLASLHTNTAADAPGRLRDLGCPPWLIAATLRLSIGQRLLRRLCTACRRPMAQTPAHLAWVEGTHYHAPGCPACAESGTRGRVASFEILSFTPERQRLVAAGADAQALLQSSDGYVPYRKDLQPKIHAGIIDAEQAMPLMLEAV
ncbi:MAG: type II/IV secretion system protein [Planctomycetota bacterium]|nr:MAG: type II/IV secretion system protein [Planctomycetota bacterium]